jgi:hypothetical protein
MTMDRLVGHNIDRFDITYLIRWSVYNGIKVPFNLVPNGKFRGWRSCIFDTMTELGAGEYNYMIKLELAARACGYEGGKTGNGKFFYQMSEEDKKEYLTADIEMVDYLFEHFMASYELDYKPVIFDIETEPLDYDNLDRLAPKFNPDDVAVGNLKDPEKIRAKIETAEANHIKKIQDGAGLQAHYSKPIAIGYKIDGKVELDFSEPKELVTRFWEIANDVWYNNNSKSI